jgi:hypothetical protein
VKKSDNSFTKEEIIKRLLGSKWLYDSFNKLVNSVDCKSYYQKT